MQLYPCKVNTEEAADAGEVMEWAAQECERIAASAYTLQAALPDDLTARAAAAIEDLATLTAQALKAWASAGQE